MHPADGLCLRWGSGRKIMVIQKAEEKSKKKALKIVMPEELVDSYMKAKALAKKKGMVFDVRPDVIKAIQKAVDEALEELDK